MDIEKVMTREVHSCSPTDTLNRAAQIMWEKDCGALPVVDDQCRVVGMVTDRDICMGSYTQGLSLAAISVASVMSKNIYSCLPEDSVGEVERLMREKRIRRVPVVDSDGDLRGIVTLGDLARCAQQSAFQKTIGGHVLAKTLAAICEPRAPGQAVAAE